MVELDAKADAWKAAFGTLANAVLGGTFKDYDVMEDSGGSTFLCTCDQKEGFPHDADCGSFLLSAREYE